VGWAQKPRRPPQRKCHSRDLTSAVSKPLIGWRSLETPKVIASVLVKRLPWTTRDWLVRILVESRGIWTNGVMEELATIQAESSIRSGSP
jgi:hypothetical protein